MDPPPHMHGRRRRKRRRLPVVLWSTPALLRNRVRGRCFRDACRLDLRALLELPGPEPTTTISSLLRHARGRAPPSPHKAAVEAFLRIWIRHAPTLMLSMAQMSRIDPQVGPVGP